MQELSVTGATLVDQTNQHQHGGHSHNHDHQERACCEPKTYQLPTIQLKKPAAELVKEYDDTQMMSTVNQIVRMGSFELFVELKDAWKAERSSVNLHAYDTSGHTLTHWAAKRIDDVRFIEYFMNLPLVEEGAASPLHRPTLDDTKMTPVHWLCTVGMNIPILSLMLEKFPNILELRDGTNCTPLLIAAQHGHVETCAFLIQKGADYRAVDSSRDTATHWAAYKGSEVVLGLLSFYDTSPLSQADAYGQTPLHLAALRGHCGTVRYIIQQLRSVNPRALKDTMQLKDSNGRTAYELAVHKQKHAVAEILEQTMHPDFRKYFTIRTCKSWIGLTDAPDESPKLPYYFVIVQIILHFMYQFGVFCPILSTGSGLLWDYVGMHVVQTIIIGLIAYTLHKTNTTNPGRLDASHPAYQEYRKLYELAVGGAAHDDIQLCHSCHIARPLRSKHCRITRSCVLGFDHHCPFVGTTVGLYNYKWFYAFLLLMTIYLFNFMILLFIYYQRMSTTSHNATILILGLVLGLHIFFPGGMLVYHTQLTGLNLTTNEHMNLFKYRYLRNQRPFSPWDRGLLNNFLRRIVSPDEKSYELPDSSLQGLLDQQRNGGV